MVQDARKRTLDVTPFAALLALLALPAVLATGCTVTGGASADSVKAAGTAPSLAPPPVDPGYYAEAEFNNRIYVFGDQKTEQMFETTHSIQISKTFIAAGPGGKTVVFEARDKLPKMTERLIATFSANHGVSLQ